MFYQQSKHLEFCQKLTPLRVVFSTLFSVNFIPMKHCLWFLIYYENIFTKATDYLSSLILVLLSKRNRPQFKTNIYSDLLTEVPVFSWTGCNLNLHAIDFYHVGLSLNRRSKLNSRVNALFGAPWDFYSRTQSTL